MNRPVTPPSPSTALPESWAPHSNVIPIGVRKLDPRETAQILRDPDMLEAWSPIDEDTAYRNAIFDLIGELLPWAVCFIVAALVGVWLAVGHS